MPPSAPRQIIPAHLDTTGIFTEGGNCYSTASITDGTSNTIAYGEALIGTFSQGGVRWRDGPVVSDATVRELERSL